MNDSCILFFSIKSGVADQVYELLLEHLRTQSSKVAFPELVVVLTVQVRSI